MNNSVSFTDSHLLHGGAIISSYLIFKYAFLVSSKFHFHILSTDSVSVNKGTREARKKPKSIKSQEKGPYI